MIVEYQEAVIGFVREGYDERTVGKKDHDRLNSYKLSGRRKMEFPLCIDVHPVRHHHDWVGGGAVVCYLLFVCTTQVW